nr:MAG: capsid protein [Cressdnaviricota sp.]
MAYGRKFTKSARDLALSAYALSRSRGPRPGGVAKRTKRPAAKKRTKKTMSFTKTKPKKEVVIKAPASGLSHSYVSNVYKPQPMGKIYRAISNSSTYEILNPISLVGAGSVQAVGTLVENYKSAELSNLFNWAQTYINQSSSKLTSAALGAGQYSFKMYLGSVINVTEFANCSPGGLEVEIYDCVSKVTANAYTSPDTAWTNGITDESEGFTVSNNQLFSVPTTSKAFNMNWRIVKRTKIELGIGRSHEHTFAHKPNRIIDTEYFNTFNMVKGITAATLFVARGTVGDSLQTNAVGVVGTGNVKLVGVCRKKYISRAVESTPRNYFQQNNLAAAPASLYTQNEGSGASVLMSATGIFG